MKLSDLDLTPKRAGDDLLDRAIDTVRDEPIDPAAIAAAATRAWQRLEQEASTTATSQHGPVTGCDGFQALIPAYLAGELPPARALLFEDHSRECVPCRRALKAAREGAASTLVPRRAVAPSPRRRDTSWLWMGLAASALLAVGVAGWLSWSGGLGGHGQMAQVSSVDGMLFRLDGDRAVELATGTPIDEQQEVRTGRGSGAMLRLADGSLIELRERSAISLARARGETTIRVNRGSIIVQAAKQHGHLYVATDDCLVSVVGTIFAVDHGTKGSKVAVVEGEVHVAEGRQQHVLLPGDRLATGTRAVAGSVATDIAWSRDRERYLAVLGELKALNEEMERALSAPDLRYSSRLLDLTPAGSTVYLGLPNVTTELADFERFLEERLAQSETLAQWWQEHLGVGSQQRLREVVDRIAGLGQHLGEEIVVSAALSGSPESSGQPASPAFLVLAEVVNPSAFAATLAAEVERLNSTGSRPQLRIVADPATAPPAGPDELLLWPAGDVFAASGDLGELQQLAATLADPAANSFVGSPFHARLLEAYQQGAQWLAGMDLGRMIGNATGEPPRAALEFSGLAGARSLIVERKTHDGVTHTGGVLSFDGPRTGALGWLAQPAPMGSLDFVSPEANLAAAFVVEQPAEILTQTFRFLATNAPGLGEQLAQFESEHQVNLIDDLAAPLGGEMAVALDGPSLPTPAWKVVAEVYDQARFEQAIEWAVGELNRLAEQSGHPGVTHGQETVGGRTYYEITFGTGPGAAYTFDGGYFVAGPSRALLDRALQVRASGLNLKTAPVFRQLLPADSYLDFSGLLFTQLGSLGQAVTSTFGANLNADQQQALASLDLDKPTLTCIYGEPDRIRLVTSGQGGSLASRLTGFLGASLPGPANH